MVWAVLVVGGHVIATSDTKTDTLLMQNVEALADEEVSSRSYTCYYDYIYEAGNVIIDCETCGPLYDRAPARYSRSETCYY